MSSGSSSAGSRLRSKIARNGLGRILLSLRDESRRDHLGIVAAGSAFFMFLALVPGLTAVALLYGLVSDHAMVLRHLELVSGYVPETVVEFARSELSQISATSASNLGFGFAGSVVLTIVFASRGARALIEGINLIERETERRGVVALYALSLAITAVALVVTVMMLAMLVALPALGEALPGAMSDVLWIGQYVALPLMLHVAIMATFRFGGSGAAQRRWWSAGAVAATVLWLLGSRLMQLYLQHVDLETAFGSTSVVAAFMLWLYLCSMSVLLGAELNDVLHHRDRPRAAVGASAH